MNNFTPRILLTGLIFIALSSIGVIADTATDTFYKKISFRQGGLISLDNINGSVEITSWDKDEVEITAYKKVHGSDHRRAEDLLAEIKIVIDENDDEINIKTDHPHRKDKNFFGWLFGGNNHSFSVQYEIKVPREVDLNISTTNGNVEAHNVLGRVRLESTNGKIIGKQISGLARCHTTNGSIKVSIVKIVQQDEMLFRTTNGSITLDLPENFGGYVDLKTTNGHIDCDFPLDAAKKHRRTELKGRVGDGDVTVQCSTTNGSINIHSLN